MAGDPLCQLHAFPFGRISPIFPFLSLYRQQAISGITQLPDDVFEGSGQVFHTFGLP